MSVWIARGASLNSFNQAFSSMHLAGILSTGSLAQLVAQGLRTDLLPSGFLPPKESPQRPGPGAWAEWQAALAQQVAKWLKGPRIMGAFAVCSEVPKAGNAGGAS